MKRDYFFDLIKMTGFNQHNSFNFNAYILYAHNAYLYLRGQIFFFY